MSCRSWVLSMCSSAWKNTDHFGLIPDWVPIRPATHCLSASTVQFSYMVLVAILVVAALILVNAVYVAAEFAAVSVRRSRIQQLAADGNPLASWLLPTLESPAALDRYIGACQIGITLSSLVLGAYAQRTIAVK